MKKLLLLVLLPSFLPAMQAPVVLEMTDTNESLSERAKVRIKDCSRRIAEAAVWCADQTCCCGCYESDMKNYLEQRDSRDFLLPLFVSDDDETVCGCLCDTYLKETNVKPCDPFLCSVLSISLCAFALKEFPLQTVPAASVGAGVGLPVFALLARRFEKVKADMNKEKSK